LAGEAENIEGLMSPERWNKLETVFDAALAVGPAEQQGFLKEACSGDRELQREVESLLAADLPPDNLLSNGAFELYMKVMAEETLKDESGHALEAEIRAGMILDDHWEILGRIDAGGMGEVYKARDRKFPSRLVVVKVLKKESQENPWKVKKFGHEGHSQSRIQHPNVATVFDRGELQSGEQYLVMEFIDGSTLRQMLKVHRETDDQIELSLVAEIMKQVGRGVAAIHQAGLVHRDLKPENIMIQISGDELVVKIIDFGIVRVLDTSTAWGQVVGTPFYMSPEQLRGEDATFTSDVYAVGVIAYELLTGRRPFELRSSSNLLGAAMQLVELQKKGVKLKPSHLRVDLPEEAERVIMKALSFEPSKRPHRVRDLGDDLARALLEAQPVAKWWRSVRARLAAAVLLALVLGVGLWVVRLSVRPNNSNLVLKAVTPSDSRQERALTYWLTIVRKSDGKETLATGRETFDTGDEFRINFAASQAGALYVFNEGTSGNWHLLFPTNKNHQGNPQLTALERIGTEGYQFTNRTGSEKGTERIWIVWAPAAVPLLDDVIKQAFKNELTISDSTQQSALRDFVTKYQSPNPDVNYDKERSQVTLKGRSDSLVYLLELENKDWK
jgi:serine/threonine protein kinase